MSYVALYRKFRPQNFDRVKGQDHIVRTIKNQIKSGRTGHAYLFTGTRGTGKTSVAKIFAKALNCLSPQDGEPCGKCENCLAQERGAFIDIVEIDAASNTGVDDIRRVIDEVQYTPAKGRYKVYIIDEVHMLSVNAFNAFLKTLEEPPAYVVFILATTEPHKLPATILSRCQRYDFKRISMDTIKENMEGLLEEEGIEADEKALRYIASTADGSMRDALSLLDRCISFSTDGKISYENVLELLGTADAESFSAMFRALSAGDAKEALKVLDDAVEAGKDLTPFITDFIIYLRNLLILNAGGADAADITGVAEENIGLLTEDAKNADINTLTRYIRVLSELLNQLRFSSVKRVLAEIAVIKLAKPQMETDDTSVLERIRALEENIRTTPAAPEKAAPAPEMVPKQEAAIQEPQVQTAPDEEEDEFVSGPEIYADDIYPPADTEAEASEGDAVASIDTSAVLAKWDDITNACDDRFIKIYLSKSIVDCSGDGVTIYANGEVALKQLAEKENVEKIKGLIADIAGITAPVYVRAVKDRPEIAEQTDISSLFGNINIEIGTEET